MVHGLNKVDHNDVREEIKFENQNSVPHIPITYVSESQII
jgi:hypothetical protein